MRVRAFSFEGDSNELCVTRVILEMEDLQRRLHAGFPSTVDPF